jgi:hypothetical protein
MMENDNVSKRIAKLESELEALKASVRGRETGKPADSDDWLKRHDPDETTDGSAASPEIKARAEKLFDALLQNRRVISYVKAYELLFGERPSPFYNAVHLRPVLEVAARTTPRKFGALEIRLDTLIVSIKGREPGPGHFRTAPYTLNTWVSTFGNWPFLK